MLPKLIGWSVCEKIREFSYLPIIMLTAKDDIKDRVRGLDHGADDYIVKPFSIEELMARIRAQLRRIGQKKEDAPNLFIYSDIILDGNSREVKRGERMIYLTSKEFELLRILMDQLNRVFAKDYLMENVWGFDYEGESNVLEVYVAMLRNKLEEQGEKRLIQTVRGVGYVLRE